MSEVKSYHVTEAGLVEGEALGRINVVLRADFDSVTRLFLDAAERAVASERREKELQRRLTEADELEADKRRLDLWQNNPGYFGGFAPSGDWSFFNPTGKTCYGKTLREALDQLGVMDADLKSRR